MKHQDQQARQHEVASEPDRQASQEGLATAHRVTIFISAHCANCDHAVEIAGLIRNEYPHIEVQLVDLANSHVPAPEIVFATPTYLLDGHVWSLGNPSPQQVRATLRNLDNRDIDKKG